MGTVTAPDVGSGSCPAWIALVSKSMLPLAGDCREAECAREPGQRALEAGLRRLAATDAGLEVEGAYAERVLRAVGLEVGASDEVVADEERQHVVAVLPL